MDIKTVLINDDFKDIKEVEDLAKEAFPSKEYLNPKNFIKISKINRLDFLALYDNNNFIGFIVTKPYKAMCYLFFLAIKKEFRNKGYGSRTLQMLKRIYPNLSQVVDFEKIENTASNIDQRKKRKDFYLRNGYKETGLYVSYFGNSYEVACTNNDFDENIFKELLSTLPLEGFNPSFSRI